MMEDVKQFIEHPAIEALLNELDVKEEAGCALERLRGVLEYSVPGGSKRRCDLVLQLFRSLKPEATKSELIAAESVAMSVQIHQAAVLVADDILDKSQLRRGKLCWYLASGLGNSAFNDTLILEQASYRLLFQVFDRQNPTCLEILELFLDVSYRLALGESLDLETGAKWHNFDTYSLEHYYTLIKYKTAYYFIYLPVGCALILAGISKTKSKDSWQDMKNITISIGQLFQIVDDYNDCFGDVNITGKNGSDIQNGKCTWLFAKAKHICDTKGDDITWKRLKEHYGNENSECVQRVKNIYAELGLKQQYDKIKAEMTEEIICKLEDFRTELKPVGNFLKTFVNKLFCT